MRSALLSAVILGSLILGTLTLTRGHQWGDDFAWYILQARSILNGTTDEFMAQSTFTNTQSTTHLGPLAYPWGYPLILAPVYALRGISPLALKLPGLLFFAGFLVCLYFLLNDRLTRNESLLLVECRRHLHRTQAQVRRRIETTGRNNPLMVNEIAHLHAPNPRPSGACKNQRSPP